MSTRSVLPAPASGWPFDTPDRLKVGGSLQVFGFNIQRVQFNYSPRANLFAAANRSNENLETASFRLGADRENSGPMPARCGRRRRRRHLTVGGTFRQGPDVSLCRYVTFPGPANSAWLERCSRTTRKRRFACPTPGRLGSPASRTTRGASASSMTGCSMVNLAEAFVNNSLPPTRPGRSC